MTMRSALVGRVAGVLVVGAACLPAVGANLVVNGNFESPSLEGINSDYLHTPGGNVVEGSWWVNPWDPGSAWHGVQHTPSGAGAMSVNGDNSTQAGIKRVWFQTVDVTAGVEYDFSAWMLGTAGGFSGYSLQFAFDGTAIGGVNSPTAAFVWEPFNASFVATGPTVTISIVNVSGITFPNDFMIDDIALEAVPGPGAAAGFMGGIGLCVGRRPRRIAG